MMIRKKRILFLLNFTLILILASCGSSAESKETETTTPALSSKMPVIVAPDIISEIGTEIDYMANLKISNATSDDYFSINVHSTSVDINTPGEYSAIYMAEYAKGMISKQVSVTIVDELSEEETVPVVIIEEVTTADTVQRETTAAPETSITQQATNSTTTTTPAATTSTPKQTTSSKSSISNALIELSNGTTVEIENTDTRYVVKTFSDESYSKKDGGRYLTSELKVEFNTGEIQVLETVITRVE